MWPVLAIVCAGTLALGAAGCLWRPARNTWIQQEYDDLRFEAGTYDYRDPALGYQLTRHGTRQMIHAGYYAFPPFDARGIPVVDYRWMRSASMPKGRFDSVVLACQYALWGCLQPYLANGDERLLQEFLHVADWVLSAQDERGAYRSPFALESRNLSRGWVSAMYQGQAASVLVRAHAMTARGEYLEAARHAIDVALTPTSEGGGFLEDDEGQWLEEYPEEPPSHVFNGLVFALYGLWDLAMATHDPRLLASFERISRTLAENLPRYTGESGARYELKRSFSARSTGYLQLQVEQALTMARMTGDGRFEETAREWATELAPRTRRSVPGRLLRCAYSALVYRSTQLRLIASRQAAT